MNENQDNGVMPLHDSRKACLPAARTIEGSLAVLPFLELPAELHNEIHRFALTDTNYCLRYQEEPARYGQLWVLQRSYCRKLNNGDRDDLPEQLCGSVEREIAKYDLQAKSKQRTLHTQLLQVCKQINQEAAPIFFSENAFTIVKLRNCNTFLSSLQSCLPLLRTLTFTTFSGICYMNSAEEVKHFLPIFSNLCYATTLEALYLDVNILRMFGRSPEGAALYFCLKAYSWIRDLATSRGNIYAVFDVIRMPRTAAPESIVWPRGRSGQEAFRVKLCKLLSHVEQEGGFLKDNEWSDGIYSILREQEGAENWATEV